MTGVQTCALPIYIAVASIRFKLAVELNIYLELIEKARILLRI